MTKRKPAKAKASGQPIKWSLRGRTYVSVPTATRRGLGRLDQVRANSMTDEGGPPPSERGTDTQAPVTGATSD